MVNLKCFIVNKMDKKHKESGKLNLAIRSNAIKYINLILLM